MSDPKDMYDIRIDLDSILLPPLKKDAIKYTFKGWKSLALLHSWDDLKIFNTDFDAIYKYEKFKKDYKYIIKNEKQLLQKITDYKIAKAKSIKKTSKTSLKKSKTLKPSKSNKKPRNMNKNLVNNKINMDYNPNINIMNNININNINNINNNHGLYYNEYNHNNFYTPYHNYPYNPYNPYQTMQAPFMYYNNHNEYGEITEMIEVEGSPPSDGNITSLSDSNNSCSTIISNEK